METTYLIPLLNIAQTFNVNLAGTNYNLTVKWDDIGQTWIMDLADDNNNMLAAGLALITGADILDGLEYLGVDGQLYVYTNGDASAVPTQDNLGDECNLYFVTAAANA